MTTPSGLWNSPEAALATMLSGSEAFQAFLDVETSADALARIHYEGLPEPADAETGEFTLAEMTALRPCAIVAAPDRDSWSAVRVAEELFVTSGQLLVWFLRSVATTHHGLPTADDVTQFKNAVGPILTDLLNLPWQSPNLATRRLSLVEGPTWGKPADVQNEGVWVGATYLLEW